MFNIDRLKFCFFLQRLSMAARLLSLPLENAE
jgi:hypothetical protein